MEIKIVRFTKRIGTKPHKLVYVRVNDYVTYCSPKDVESVVMMFKVMESKGKCPTCGGKYAC